MIRSDAITATLFTYLDALAVKKMQCDTFLTPVVDFVSRQDPPALRAPPLERGARGISRVIKHPEAILGFGVFRSALRSRSQLLNAVQTHFEQNPE